MKVSSKKYNAYRYGLLAETIAVAFLFFKGYRILARRYKTKVGEIDVVAKRKDCLIFLEVKARKDLDMALQSVLPYSRKRIERAANYYLMKNQKHTHLQPRFDFFAYKSLFSWRYLDNAWQSDT